MPSAARRLGEAFDDCEAGLAQSIADGSWLARLLMQLLVLLREALVRFASDVPSDTTMVAVPDVSLARVADAARPMRARRARVASGRVAARGVLAADGLASVVVRVAAVMRAQARNQFSSDWVGIEQLGFSKSLWLCGQICVLIVTISKQNSLNKVHLVLFVQQKDYFPSESCLGYLGQRMALRLGALRGLVGGK